MISTRAQLRLVALFYGAVAVLGLVALATIISTGASMPSASIMHKNVQHATNAFPLAAVTAVFYLVLSGLSLRFLALPRAWRIATIGCSLLASFTQIGASARDTLIVTPTLLNFGPNSYGTMAVELGVFWGRALAFSLCSYLLWKRLRLTGGVERS